MSNKQSLRRNTERLPNSLHGYSAANRDAACRAANRCVHAGLQSICSSCMSLRCGRATRNLFYA